LLDGLAPTPLPPAIIPVEPPTSSEAGEQKKTEPVSPQPTPEQTAIIADLHWLVHQGHVIEFANGVLETAKKPIPKPPKAEPKPTETVAAAAEKGGSEPTEAADSAGENVVVETPAAETGVVGGAEAEIGAVQAAEVPNAESVSTEQPPIAESQPAEGASAEKPADSPVESPS
jgi:hypothetical protein